MICYLQTDHHIKIDNELADLDSKSFDFRISNDEDYIEYETKDKKDFIITNQQPSNSNAQTINVSIASNAELGQV